MTKQEMRRAMRALPHPTDVLHDDMPLSGTYVMLYWPLPDEVDSRPFIQRLHDAGVHVVLPIIEGDDIRLRLYAGKEAMQPGAFGILEPQGPNFTDTEAISRIYIPGLAFTSEGHRLGRGRGYYDRFLSSLPHTPQLIGVCAPGHLVPSLPTEAHDIRMNRVISHFLILCMCAISACTIISCKRTTPPDNPAFTSHLDTTGADDPYIYEGDSAYAVAEAEHIRRVQQSWRLRHQVHRNVRAPYINKEKGLISTYDDLFKEASAITGWDWRLIAAQCYQESGFDPEARSGAGARGLMQIMPGTARELGLAPHLITSPSHNIEAAARYIRQLSALFSDIRQPQERIHFTLAAYNGGYQHVRDAMALTRKYGGSPQHWADVSRYILALQQPRYYRDPVVKHGYMIGSETANYVVSIVQRARQYGANLNAVSLPPGWKEFKLPNAHDEENSSLEETTKKSRINVRTNRFTRNNSEVLRPEELQSQPTD